MNIKEEWVARNPDSNANGSSISFDELDRIKYEKKKD